jgi:hypothetical protein
MSMIARAVFNNSAYRGQSGLRDHTPASEFTQEFH